MSENEDRIHDPTPSRIQAARMRGDVPKSEELAIAISLLAILAVGSHLLVPIGTWMQQWTAELWRNAPKISLNSTEAMAWGQETMVALLVTLAPILLSLLVIHTISYWLQTGPMWNLGLAGPDPQRLGPAKWIQNASITRMLTSSMFGIPKVLLTTTVTILGVWQFRNELARLPTEPMDQIVQSLFLIVNHIAILAAVTMVGLGGIDFYLNWRRHRNRLRMSEQELRDEMDQQEGDAVNRSRQRQLDRV